MRLFADSRLRRSLGALPLSLAVYAGAALGMGLLLVFFLALQYRQAEQAAEASVTNVVRLLEARLDATLRRVESALTQLAVRLPPDALDGAGSRRYRAAMEAELRLRAAGFHEIYAYRVVDSGGATLYSSDGDLTANFRDRDWFRALQGNPRLPYSVSDVFTGLLAKRPIVVIAKPIGGEAGVFKGAALASLDLTAMQELLGGLDLGPKGLVALRRVEDGRLVLRQPAVPQSVNQPLPSPSLYRVQAGEREGLFRFTASLDRTERLFAFRKVGDYPFVVSAGAAVDDYLAAWRRAVAISTSGAALVLALIGFFAWRAWRSERREAQARESMRRSEERFRSYSESTSDWFWETDANLVLTYVSENYPAQSGDITDWQAGRSLPGLIAAATQGLPHQEVDWLARISRHESFRDCDVRMRATGGAIRWASVSATALLSAEGRFMGYRGTGRDVTRRKQLEAEIDAIFTASAAGIALIRERVFVRCNPGMDRMFGYAPGETIGRSTRIHHRSDKEHERIGREAAESIGRTGIYQGEFEMVRKDGTPIWIYGQGRPVDPGNPSEGTIITFTDISERKRIEWELLRARDEAERANEAKSEFLSSMSHELRTPLNAILGFAQILDAGERSSLAPGRRATAVSEILKGGWHLLSLIDDVLDLARVESGRVQLSIEPVRLVDVVGECVALAAPLAAQRGLQLHNTLSPAGAVMVSADATRLKQVLLNLISNAVKYNVAQGSVVLSCAATADARVRFSVADTGLGMDAEQLKRLFRPFDRLGREKSDIEGTGIGLMLTRRLVELMHGTIGVQSEPGRGSTFWVELPAAGAAARVGEEGPAPEPQVPPRTEERVLLYVEDNPSNVRLMETILEARPQIRLITAHDGLLGLELARAHRPDLMVIDVNLPGLSGLELCGRLRSDPATRDIPLMGLSANAMQKDIDKGMRAGFTRYFTKPLNVNLFLADMDAILRLAQTAP